MWRLDNQTPFAADRTWIRDGEGAEVWVVAVKATYDILPDGSTRIADPQVPVHSGPLPHEGLASLRHDTDLGPAKAATDILLNGHAHAQGGRPVRDIVIGFRVGSLSRTAQVWGDRWWQRGWLADSASRPAPFLRMPLVYERAFGGDAPDGRSGNPVGRGFAPGAQGRVWLPNIEAPSQPIRGRGGRGDRARPIGFGAISSHWPQRSQYAGTCDRDWFEQRFPLPPRDQDPRHWQIAPPEQQVPGHLKGGEPVVLVNLTPPGYAPGGRLAFHLPKLSLAFQTCFLDGTKQFSRSVIHSLILEPDFPRLCVVHHMTLPCHPKVNLLDKTLITRKQRPLDRRPDAPHDALDGWPEAAESARA